MVRLILLIIIAFILFAFSYMNREKQVPLHLLWKGETAPIAVYLIVVGAFLAGTVFAAIMTFPGWLKAKLEKRKLNKRIEQLETDLDHLRAEALKVAPPRYPSLTTESEENQDEP